MTRRAWIAAGVVLLVAVVALVWRSRTAASPPPTASAAIDAPSVSLVAAEIATYTAHVRAHGSVGAPEGGQSRLPFAESGIVASIDVAVGDRVVAGQIVARLNAGATGLDAARSSSDAQMRSNAAAARLASIEAGSSGAASDAAAASAALQQSQAKLALDAASLRREQQLYDAGVAATKDVAAARAQLEVDRTDVAANRVRGTTTRFGVTIALTQAQADVAQAQGDVRGAARKQANAALRAPSNGIVAAILKHAGEAVDPTQPVMVVAAPTSDTITLTVALAQAPGLRPGDRVALRIPTRGLRGDGIVSAVVPSADALTQTANVVVAGVPAGAQTGDAVEATIALATSRRRGIVIPTDAIVQDPESGATIVFVRTSTADGQRFTARTIVVGSDDDASTLVKSGLRAGERIAAHGAYDLLAPVSGG